MAKMGIGLLGGADLVFKRKFRWTLSFSEIGPGKLNIPADFLKSAARPNLEIEETEINYMNAKMFIPGKATWQTTEVVYLDIADMQLKSLWQWIIQIYNVMDRNDITTANRSMGSQVRDYAGKGNLSLYDGCGNELEVWTLYSAWPKTVDFGELDYSSSDVCEVKMTLRYADVGYVSKCPPYQGMAPRCSPCKGTSQTR